MGVVKGRTKAPTLKHLWDKLKQAHKELQDEKVWLARQHTHPEGGFLASGLNWYRWTFDIIESKADKMDELIGKIQDREKPVLKTHKPWG